MRNTAGIALCLSLAPAIATAADTDRRTASDFHLLAEIETDVPLRSRDAYAVTLQPDAIQALREGGELRLFDANGVEVPSMVHTAVARQQTVKRPVEIFNQGWESTGSGVVQTLTTRLTDRQTDTVNEFEFDIDEDRYNASVRVEASEDGTSWRILRDGLYLIRHAVRGESIRYAHDTLRVPTARFRDYRFTLSLPGRGRPLDVKAVTVRETVSRGSSSNVPASLERWHNDDDPDRRHEYWKLDLGRSGLGVDRIRLDVAASNYERGAGLSEWNDTIGRQGRRLAHTVAFDYGEQKHAELSDFVTDARVLVLMIDQGDDTPVKLTSATASRPRQQLRFLAVDSIAPPLSLYLGPDMARAPQYDLPRTLREREIATFTELRHAPVGVNAAYTEAPPPLTERIPYLLYGVVGLLVVGLGTYIARTVKAGLPPEPPPPGDGTSH